MDRGHDRRRALDMKRGAQINLAPPLFCTAS
jgi:hypothetical protein